MCFAPQRRALFRHLNFQKWSGAVVFCTFWLRNVLYATTACTFSTSQLPKVVRTWCVLCILTSKCASRHNGVQFFFRSHKSLEKHSVSRLSYLFAHLDLLSSETFSFFDLLSLLFSSLLFFFFLFLFLFLSSSSSSSLPFPSLLFSSLLFSSFLFSSLLFFYSYHLCFSSVQISFDHHLLVELRPQVALGHNQQPTDIWAKAERPLRGIPQRWPRSPRIWAAAVCTFLVTLVVVKIKVFNLIQQTKPGVMDRWCLFLHTTGTKAMGNPFPPGLVPEALENHRASALWWAKNAPEVNFPKDRTVKS